MRLLFLFLLALPFVGFSQKGKMDFPRDTSFNVRDSWAKLKKDYPEITPVNEFTDLKIKEKREVVYSTIGQRKLHADVFYPVQDKGLNHPGIILIHGGGWASGNKSHLVPLAQKLAEGGYVAASVEYRLSPEARYPAGVIDLKTAIKWVKINAGDYGLDTSKIAVLGTSAGATLATLLGTTVGSHVFPSHQTEKQVSDKVQAIVNMDGILDFTDPAESGKDDNPEKPSAGARWFGATYREKPELWIQASPVQYVGKDTPPTLFVNSSLPRFHAGRDKYLEVLDKYNIYYEVHTIANTPHPYWLFHPWFDEVYPMVLNFLDKVFK